MCSRIDSNIYGELFLISHLYQFLNEDFLRKVFSQLKKNDKKNNKKNERQKEG